MPPVSTAHHPAPDGNAKARQPSLSPGHYFLAKLADRQRYRSFYVIVALFIGFMGFHNLYAGRYLWAAAQFLAYWVSATYRLPSLFILLLIIALLEIILVNKDGKGRKMPWISGFIW